MSYPDERISWGLAFRNLFFPFVNPLFGVLPAAFYVLIAWATGINVGEHFREIEIKELGRLGISQFAEAVTVGIHSVILSEIGMGLYALVFLGFVIFTQTRSLKFRWIAGGLHGLSHVVMGFIVFWAASYLSVSVLHLYPKSIAQYLVSGVMMVPLSWIGGSMVVGVYLLISNIVFGEHKTDSFSSLRIQDWKGFLRMQICADGRLKLFFIGIRRVPRRWGPEGAGAPQPRWVSLDPKASSATLEDYFEIQPRKH